MNLEVEKDFMPATLIAQMDEIAKKMKKVEAQYKQKDRYIPSHEIRNCKDREAKRIEKLLSTIILEVTKKDKALEELKGDIEGMKLVIWSHSRATQVLANMMGQESMLLNSQIIREQHSGGVVNNQK